MAKFCHALLIGALVANVGWAIQGGKLSAKGAHPGVVALTNAAGKIFCTGFLVAPRLVVTAAHCLQREKVAETVRVYLGDGDQGLIFPQSDLHLVERAAIHPEYEGYYATPKHDVAYAVLKDPVKLPPTALVTPLADYDELDAGLVAGHDVKLIGYGCYDQQLECHGGQKAEVDVNINSFSLFIAKLGTSAKRSLWGDSGGPAIIDLGGGRTRVIGVTSQNSDDKEVAYTLLHPHLCWIARDSKVAVPGAEKHCYDDYRAGAPGPFVARTLEMIYRKAKGGTSLNLDHGALVDLTPLAAVAGLESVSLAANPRAHLEELAQVKGLRTLRVDVDTLNAPTLKALREKNPDLKIVSANPERDLLAAVLANDGDVYDLSIGSLTRFAPHDARNVTLFMPAVQKGRVRMAAGMIAVGADVSASEPDQGHTVLIYAVLGGNLDMVKALVAAGADRKARNKWGKTARELAEQWDNRDIAAYLKGLE